jgi:hypothetical protein
MFFGKKSKAPLWSDQQELASDEKRDDHIAKNIVKLLQDTFPDDTIEKATINHIKHYTNYSTVECILVPNDTGRPSYILVISFENNDSGELIAGYAYKDDKYSLLFTGNAPKDMPDILH